MVRRITSFIACVKLYIFMQNIIQIIAVVILTGAATIKAGELIVHQPAGGTISQPSLTLDGVKPLASWIWDRGDENPLNTFLLVRKVFKLEDEPEEATAYISAYASADVYINGKLLERCPINCDPEYQCYDHFNITKYLRRGDNCISAVIQNFGVGMHSQMNARGGFFLQAQIDDVNGRSENLLTDSSWKVTRGRAWNNHSRFREPNAHLIGFVEEFDARQWPEGWQQVGFDDSSWAAAKAIGVPPVAPWNHLVVTERPQLVRKVVNPVRKWQAGNLMVFDFGPEIVGYPQFTITSAKPGISIEVGTGERLDKNRAPLLRASSDHSERYTTREGRQSWKPYTWTGFRYFSMETNLAITVEDVTAEFACYDYEMDGSFECSDPQLNEFWNIGKHTMQINSVDTYLDPWREHTQYIAGDSRFMMIYGNYAFGESSRFLSAYNLLCGAESQRWRPDGAVRSRYPTDYFLQPGSSAYLADYQLEWVLMMHEYFMFYGTDDLIVSLYPNLKKAVEFFRPSIDPKTGLLAKLPGWIVLDWPDTFSIEKKNIITGINCQYYGALNAAADIAADLAHDPAQARVWRQQANELRANINKYLWSEKDHAYLDSYEGTQCGQQAQVYALVYKVPDEPKKADVINRVMSRGKASEESFAYWVLNSMFTAGKDHWALDYMRKNWGDQTKLSSFNGAWQEGWNLPWGSTSHAWSSGPTALLSQKVLGLEPTGYGWSTFVCRPRIGDLKWARGTVSTGAGKINTSWATTAGNHFTMTLDVPVGTTATVYLPAADPKTVQVNKQRFGADGEAGNVVLTAHAGKTEYECELSTK